ncbi:MAG: gamma-glutamylcyclotransferase family protein [Euryarchaeota archaeon]|nr:gamma-glutamylcyclotransferase family protein [Euryarchaeota archaeon]
MMKRASADAHWLQPPAMRPYLVKSIARFNEARVCSEAGAEIKACGLIQDGLDMLRAGLGACQDPGSGMDWLRSEMLDELAVYSDRAGSGVDLPSLWGIVDWLFDYPVNRLAIYGTLRRGEPNHKIIEHIAGEWVNGLVRGRIEEHYGFPFFVSDDQGDMVSVEVLSSFELPGSWERIDRFEGVWYHRTMIPVHDSDGSIIFIANIYCKSEKMFNPGLLHRAAARGEYLQDG